MKASILDLRYRMKDVLKALTRGEAVHILYHGKEKGTLIPSGAKTAKSVKEHPFFGMHGKARASVDEVMQDLRKSRYHDL